MKSINSQTLPFGISQKVLIHLYSLIIQQYLHFVHATLCSKHIYSPQLTAVLIVIGYEPADLTVHPPPAEGRFIFFV